MNEGFKIYVDRLEGGAVEKIDEAFDPAFIDVNEDGLKYTRPVIVKGEAYLAEKELVLHLEISSFATLLCSICNRPVEVDISIKGHYHVVPLEEIKSGIYLIADLIREQILLETPKFAECNHGRCQKRDEYKVYLKDEDQNASDGAFHPFEDL